MNKKIILMAAAFMLLFGTVGQAVAYFADGDLIRVVYDRGGTYEVVTDLGSGWARTSTTTDHKLFNANNFSLSQLGSPAWSNTYVAYFIAQTGPNGAWTSGTDQTGQSRNGKMWNTFLGGVHTIEGLNQGAAQNVNQQSDASSYASVFGFQGTFAGFLTSETGDKNLAGLATKGYVDQWLYYYNNPGRTGADGVNVYQIRTYANGYSEINPVPVPAALYLFGSGLFGLVAFRRRKSA